MTLRPAGVNLSSLVSCDQDCHAHLQTNSRYPGIASKQLSRIQETNWALLQHLLFLTPSKVQTIFRPAELWKCWEHSYCRDVKAHRILEAHAPSILTRLISYLLASINASWWKIRRCHSKIGPGACAKRQRRTLCRSLSRSSIAGIPNENLALQVGLLSVSSWIFKPFQRPRTPYVRVLCSDE